ncbi:peptide/nickel transport system permease protein [Marmoricola sp. URHA0025 HA25]
MAIISAGVRPESIAAAMIRRRRSHRRWEAISFRTGLVLFAVLVLTALAQPVLPLAPSHQQDLAAALSPPSMQHPFGTDDVGRDILSRSVSALSLDLRVAIVVTAISVLIGISLGAVAGMRGGFIDAAIMRAADIVLAFPFLVLIICMIAAVGPGLKGVYIAVPLAGWALYARFTRAEMLSIRERDFVSAARTLGYSRSRVLLRHALPNVVQPAIVYSMIDVVMNIVALATLSFLGLGVQPPTAELGGIISDGQQYVLTAWWITVMPGGVLVLIGLSLSLIGDGLAARMGQGLAWTK